VSREEIEQRFVDAGWELDRSFIEHLIIGYRGDDISLLAHQEMWGNDDPIFEILDHEQMLSSWVTEILSPQQAEKLVCLVRDNSKSLKVWEQP
jgi:hypothetical protein